jgi:hypothetical protein
MLLTAIIGALCLVLIVGAFIAPRLSKRPQKASDRTLEEATAKAKKAPGVLSRLMPKSFQLSEKAVDKSAGAGRKGREKVD